MAPSSPVGEIGSLTNRVALITGGSSGLGRAIARAYAAAGAYVVSADVTSQPPPAPAAAESPQDHDLTTPTVDLLNADWPSKKEGQQRAEFIKCDVTDEESVKAAVAFAVEKYGRLDILVNNAGKSTIAPWMRWLDETDSERVVFNQNAKLLFSSSFLHPLDTPTIIVLVFGW